MKQQIARYGTELLNKHHLVARRIHTVRLSEIKRRFELLQKELFHELSRRNDHEVNELFKPVLLVNRKWKERLTAQLAIYEVEKLFFHLSR